LIMITRFEVSAAASNENKKDVRAARITRLRITDASIGLAQK